MTSHAEAFAAKARRALRAARLLAEEGETEGACNRAYYAMYYAAQVALCCVIRAEIEYKTHRGLVADFGRHVVLGGHLDADFGRYLNEVQRIRELADYLGEPPSDDDSAFALGAAEMFVAAIEALESTPPAPDPGRR